MKNTLRSLQRGIHSLEEIAGSLHGPEDKKVRITLTNGCFDILHRGHVDYLRKSSTLGELLIVGVNSDEAVRAMKGPGRPRNTLADRMEVLRWLRFVDYVFPLDGQCFADAIRQIKPHFYTKGGDYEDKRLKLSEREALEETGAEVRIIPATYEISTTQILNERNSTKS